MPAVKHGVAFVLLRRTEKLEHRLLQGFQGENTVVSSVDHQRGHPHAGSKIDFIYLRASHGPMKPSAEQHRHPDPCFDRWENRPEIRSQAQAVISELLVVEVLACLDVVDRSSQVLRPFNNVVAVGGGLRPGQRLVPAFVSALIDWVNERPGRP